MGIKTISLINILFVYLGPGTSDLSPGFNHFFLHLLCWIINDPYSQTFLIRPNLPVTSSSFTPDSTRTDNRTILWSRV